VWLPRLLAYSPPLESIETVNIVTNSMDAEQGMSGGAAVNVTTQSGTNEFHGAGYEYHTNSALKAKNVFFAEERKPKYIQNQWGGALGGPIVRNRLFFFVGHERTNRRSNTSRLFTVPTADQRAGDFSAYSTTIYDPLTGAANGSGRTAFEGNRIPLARQSRVARQILSWMPLPTTTGVTANFFGSGVNVFDRHSTDAKVNWNKSDKFTMFGRFSILPFSQIAPVPFGEASGPPIDSTNQAGYGEGLTINTSVGMNYVVTSTFLLDGNFGYAGITPRVRPFFYGKDIGRDVLNLPGTNGPTEFYSGIPEFVVSGYTTMGEAGSANPYYWRDNNNVYTGNAAWTKGGHSVRFGFDVARERLNHDTAEAGGGPRGSFQFNGGVTALQGGASPNQFNAFAAFLLGLPSTVARAQASELPVTARAWREGYYVRDQWQATRNLTVTLGLRYEYYPMITRKDRGIELYDVTTNQQRIGGVGSVPTDLGVRVSKTHFTPRLGLAYRIGTKWVIRSGFGVNTDPYSLSRPFRTNYPLLIALDVVAPNSFQFARRTEEGIPAIAIPNLGNGTIPIPLNVASSTLDETYRRGYIQSYNLTVQRELPWGFAGQVGYVGSRHVRPLLTLQLNYAEPGQGNAGRVLTRQFGRTAGTTVRRPLGTNHYDSLQSTLTRRFSGCCQLTASYTYSKSISYSTDWSSPSVFNRNRALSAYDIPHNFQAGWVVEGPFGRGKRWANDGIGSVILGGWQLNGIFSRYSGTPFHVTSNGASLNAPGNLQTADQVKPEVKILGGTGRDQPYFDPLAFRPVTDVRYGNSGIYILRGPGVVNLDLGLFREFRATEKFRVQFRAEAFNATNTPHFNNPGTNVSNLLLNPDGSVNSLRGYSDITSARQDERQVRFGLRLSF
jgi:hypothetical protein